MLLLLITVIKMKLYTTYEHSVVYIPFFAFIIVHGHCRDEHATSSCILVVFLDIRPVDNPIIIV